MPRKCNDATRRALERIATDGSDMDQPMKMDFFVAVPNEKAGHLMAACVVDLGFETSVEQDTETGEWTCYCTKYIVPDYSTVVDIESQLNSLACDIGGNADGFGTFGNAETRLEGAEGDGPTVEAKKSESVKSDD